MDLLFEHERPITTSDAHLSGGFHGRGALELGNASLLAVCRSSKLLSSDSAESSAEAVPSRGPQIYSTTSWPKEDFGAAALRIGNIED